MSDKRRIAVVSSSRADYGHLYWVLKELQALADVDLRILATAAHCSPRFGTTAARFAADGFVLEACIESLLDSDSDTGMAKTTGLATLGLADALDRLRPDLLLTIADRYEMLAPVTVALALRIPIAHIEGGEISEGAIDDAVRNAMTKLSHLHFVPTEQARRRVLAMGEEAWRVHLVGAPSIDHLRRSRLPEPVALAQQLGLPADVAPVVVAYHPVTLLRDSASEAGALFDALEDCAEPVVFCFPNADAGREALIARAKDFCARHASARLFINLDPIAYWGLLKLARMLVGNSSSGIMETPSLALPCVNIGLRQAGRERARNIIDAEAETGAIITAMQRARSAECRDSLIGMSSPYGEGHAARAIAKVLREVPLDDRLLRKRALPLRDTPYPAFQHES